jgi:hypothetical protein
MIMSHTREQVFKFEFPEKKSLFYLEQIIAILKKLCDRCLPLNHTIITYSKKEFSQQLAYLQKRNKIIGEFRKALDKLIKKTDSIPELDSLNQDLEFIDTNYLLNAEQDLGLYSGLLNPHAKMTDEFIELSSKIDFARFINLDKFVATDCEFTNFYLQFLGTIMTAYKNMHTDSKNLLFKLTLKNRLEYLHNEYQITKRSLHGLTLNMSWLQELITLQQKTLELCAKINELAIASGKYKEPLHSPEKDEWITKNLATSESYFEQTNIKQYLQKKLASLQNEYADWSKYCYINSHVVFFNNKILGAEIVSQTHASGYRP